MTPILLVVLPPWVRYVAAGVIGLAILWVLAGETLIRNRRKLDALWCAQLLTLMAATVTLIGFFTRLFGSVRVPFHGYDLFAPDRPAMVGYVTLAAVAAVMVMAPLTRPTRTGLLLAAFQALLGVFGGVIWVPWIAERLESLAYGVYLLEAGFAGVVVAALWQFKVVGDRMPPPGEG